MANHHPSPTMMQLQQQQQQQQHQAPVAPPQSVPPGHFAPSHQIAAMNEAVWLQIGELLVSCAFSKDAAPTFVLHGQAI